MPKRRLGSGSRGKIALLHALAHIELNAIDLAWDMVARFSGEPVPQAFFDDWVSVAADEARHFVLLNGRLNALGSGYGELPAHDGLWEAAEITARDLLARLAIVPLVLEARGLDVTPELIEKLERIGDHESAECLTTIYQDEIRHVAAGRRWFEHLSHERGLDPPTAWRDLVRRYFKGRLKPPFNEAGRREAGFPPVYYEGLEET